jgi:hypothetical protein
LVSASAGASASTTVRVRLDGQGPIGLDVAGNRGWVIQTDSGGLVEVDLERQQIDRTLDVPAGGSQVVASHGDTVYVGRYTPDSSGRTIAIADLRSGDVTGLSMEPIGGLGVDRSAIWALQTSGKVSRIDRLRLEPTGSVSVHVDSDAHMDALVGAGSVWVSGDRTPVHRISGSKPRVVADIETGGGIPLAFDRGLVWGARPDQLWAIDPKTNRIVRRVPLSDLIEILALDVAGDEAWIAARRPGRVGTVIQFDIATRHVRGAYDASLPAGVRIGSDRAWATDYETGDLIGFERDCATRARRRTCGGQVRSRTSTTRRRLPSGSRSTNIGTGTGMTSASTSTPAARRAAWSAWASVVVRRICVSIPAAAPEALTSAIEVVAPIGATSSQRWPGANSPSSRFSKPSLPV